MFAPRKEPLLLSAVNDSVVRISPPSRWNGAPTTARKHRCSLMGCCFAWVGEPKGCRGRAESTCLCRYTPTLPEGNPLRVHDAPTTARTVGLPPRGGKYFLSKRKKVPKKARGTATTEAARPAVRRGLRSAGALRAVLDLGSLRSPAGKKPFIAHFDGGARNVARNGVGQLSPALEARSCSPFSAVKMGGPFSLRCLSPLCSPAVGVGQTQMAVLGMFWCC